MKVSRRLKRTGAWCLGCLVAALTVMSPATAAGADVTVLVNGSIDQSPDWVHEGSAEWNAIAETFGYPPTAFTWTDNSVAAVVSPLYTGIYSGGFDLATFLNGVGGDNLNVISHSHGGNVTLIAMWYLTRPVRHLINLGTPINWELLPARYASGSASSNCQVSSYADYVQVAGSSPLQVGMFIYNQALAGYYFYKAIEAAIDEDWALFEYYLALSAERELEANWWWWTCKAEWFAPTLWFVDQNHGQLHEPDVWNQIKYQCALS
jgi:pimeloyl-ACP methyl ester carboxylesterase